ncbi:MAG: hypothetical protein D3906_04360 [Candidatus Electrothrix sp. AUS1_2]|nr:hypothetical protein [Candidatus Electrothrix sp. AUS1_2]
MKLFFGIDIYIASQRSQLIEFDFFPDAFFEESYLFHRFNRLSERFGSAICSVYRFNKVSSGLHRVLAKPFVLRRFRFLQPEDER